MTQKQNEAQVWSAGSIPMSTDRALPMVLLQSREVVMAYFRPFIHSHGFTEQQWRVLRTLMEHEAMKPADIATSCCIMRPSMSRILKTLEEKGFVTRVQDEQDGRSMLISISGLGKKTIKDLIPESERIYKKIIDEFGEDQFNRLLTLLTQLIDHLTLDMPKDVALKSSDEVAD